MFCRRHQCYKTQGLWQFCQERGKFWDAWEKGVGPMQEGAESCGDKAKAKAKKEEPVDPDFHIDLSELGVICTDAQGLRSLWQQWRTAIKKWKAAGKPVRTDEEMQACLAICLEPCEFYGIRLGTFGYCKVCLCNVNKLKFGELNKIRMKTEACPKKKWQ